MADEDPEYCRWLLKQPCCSCGSTENVVVHHHTRGGTDPLFPVEGEPLPRLARGLGQRAHDHWGIPLCSTSTRGEGCHEALHRGHPLTWTGGWQDRQVREFRTRYLDKETF
jgi:hypothetical protein